MDIIDQIQMDLLDSNIPLSDILRKAKVLASQLDNEELGVWATHELDGYETDNDLPDYRIIHTTSSGHYTNGFRTYNNFTVPVHAIKNEKTRDYVSKLEMKRGIKSIEELARMGDDTFLVVHPTIVAMVNSEIENNGYYYLDLHYSAGSQIFSQMLDTIRNRLLDFILKINKSWKIRDNPPKREIIDNLVHVSIYNNSEGGSMSVFDQRNQNVTYQYNSAGNINIELINSPLTFADEVGKFMDEISEAEKSGLIDKEKAIEIKYHLLTAKKEAKSEKPNKEIIGNNLGNILGFLKNISTLVSLVTGIEKLIEIIPKIFN